MKMLIRIFISLYVFLLAGLGQMHAHVQQDNLSYTPIKIIEKAHHTGLYDFQNRKINIKSTLSSLGRVNDKVDTSDNEDEDEKLLSLKKFSANNNFFLPVVATQIPGYFYPYLTKCFIPSTRFNNFSSQRIYILFQVFRI